MGGRREGGGGGVDRETFDLYSPVQGERERGGFHIIHRLYTHSVHSEPAWPGGKGGRTHLGSTPLPASAQLSLSKNL